MKKLLTLALIGLPFVLSAQHLQKNFIDQNYVEVTGRSEMKVVPNQIDIQIIINEGEGKGKPSLTELEQQMIRVLSESGFDLEEDLVVKDLASNFKNFLFLSTDIRLSKEYVLTVDEAKKAAKVFLELQKIGISNMNIVRLDHSELEKYRQEVKVEAIRAARNKAASLAAAVDQETGRALYIQEFDRGIRRPMASNTTFKVQARGTTEMEEMTSETIPEMEFESIHLEAAILVRFELK